MQVQEQEELSIKEKATLFQQLLEKRRNHFAAKRAEEKRNKPPTKAQQRKIIASKRVNTFEDFRTDLVEHKEKRARTKLVQEIIKKQKVEDDKETAKLKQLMKIILDEDEVEIDAIPLAVKEDLEDFYKLVKAKYDSTRPVEDLDLLLWGNLKTMFEPHIEDKIYMLVEKKYPLAPLTLSMMLEKKLMIDYESEMVYQLLKFIMKQLKKSLFEKEKLTGPNFIDWYRQLRILLSVENKENYLEHPVPAAPVATPGQQVPPQALAAHAAWVKGSKEIAEIELPSNQTKEFHSLQQEEGQSVSSYVLNMKSYINNLERLGQPVSLRLAVSLILISLSKKLKDFPFNLAKLLTKKKLSQGASTLGLGRYRKLKLGALSLYVGDGHRAAVEAIGEYHLCLPSGLVLILHNCHYAPSITRGIISVSRLYKDGFINRFENDNTISVSRNNLVYFCAILRDDIYEIDLSSFNTNDSSMYAISNKRAKLNLDSTLLWHCRLGHISKKRIKKLQHDRLLISTDIKSFKKCVSCMSGKMARKPYSHQVERAKDLLGPIHTDVCGPFRTVSRQGASYFVTFTDDFSRYGYVYLLKHKHEVFETFKVFQKVVENQLGKTIKSLCFDHGGEYMSQEFLDHLKEHRIIAHRTPPYTPQHNGVSERRNRTLLNMFFENSLITQEASGSLEEDMHPSIDTSLIMKRMIKKLMNLKVISIPFRMQNIPYASAVGSIMYAVRCTRPDIAFAQNMTSRFQHNPGELHWTTVKNILKYLRNTKDMFLIYGGDMKRELRVSCYTDVGYLTDAADLKSQTGYVFVLNGGAVDWKST
ncbi:retrotransposon protein, putative, ty1-copia subclass [Tanacetum coccineum]